LYDPYLNRFTQPDSIVPLASQGTQAWDRYAYANNNPVKYTDPSGHAALLIFAAILPGLAIGGLVAWHASTLVIPGADRRVRDSIGRALIADQSEAISRESSKHGIDSSLVASVLRHEGSAFERRMFTWMPGVVPGKIANAAESLQIGLQGENASIGPGQMQLQRAIELEQLGYVTPRNGMDATMQALLGNDTSVEYIAGMLHYISDQLQTLPGYNQLSVEDQQRLILLGYNWGWTNEFQEALQTLGFQGFIEEENYDNQTMDAYNDME
jgi:hypothetical protein